MIAMLLSLALFATASASGAQSTISTAELITLSRQATVKVVYQGGQPAGTGFFISPTHVATCFHVVINSWSARLEGGKAKDNKWEPRSRLQVITYTGQVLDAQMISVPTPDDVAPMQYDFAVLQVLTAPLPALTPLSLSSVGSSFPVGTEVHFSGYPLDAPAMLTHRGLISGYTPTPNLVCIQGPINRGHSGSALLSPDGHVIGIVNEREGGFSKELEDTWKLLHEVAPRLGGISHEIETSEGRKSISETKLLIATVDTLHKYINTGIGYAREITFLKAWLRRHPLKPHE